MKIFAKTVQALVLLFALLFAVPVYATTYNQRVGSTGTQLPAHRETPVYRLKATVSFADQATSVTDVVQLFNIPAGTFVVGVAVSVTTAEGGTSTIDVGDATDTDGYFDNLSVNSAVKSFSSPGLPATTVFDEPYCQGRYYADAGVISVICNTADSGVAVFTVTAICVKVID